MSGEVPLSASGEVPVAAVPAATLPFLPATDDESPGTPLPFLASLAVSVVHPGHGDATTIGEEKISNPFLNGTARIVRA